MPVTVQSTAIYLLAILAAVCGTWVLQAAWRFPARQWHLVLLGWILVFTSLYVWTLTTTTDKGIALGIAAWVMIAVLFLLRSAMKSPVRAQRKQRKIKAKSKEGVAISMPKSQIAVNALTVLTIGPLAGLAAMLMSTLLLCLMQLVQLEYTATIALTMIIFPVFWAGLAVMLGYQQRLSTRLVTVAVIGLGSSLCLWLVS